MNLITFKAIVSGWTNVVFKNKDIEELATVRAKICADCPHANQEYPFKKFLPKENNRIEIIKGLACNLCGCPLSAKTRQVLTSCPDKRWD